jgi:hypothetical protein
MIRVMFDTNVNDVVALDEEYRQLLIKAQEKKFLVLLTTHIQSDQINDIPDSRKRNMVYSVNVSAGTTETHGIVLGISRLNWSKFAPKEEIEQLMGNKKRNKGNLSDALIASTALKEVDLFVTDDGSLKRKYERFSRQVMDSSQFKVYLKELF